MRLVRFHLEPWQKGGSDVTVTPCASPLPLSNRVHRRQRSADDAFVLSANNADLSETREKRRRAKQIRWRYPPVIKRLAMMCSDVIAHNVRNVFMIIAFHF